VDRSVLLFACLEPHKHSKEGEGKHTHKWEREDKMEEKDEENKKGRVR